MANKGKFESVFMRIGAASWLLSLCPLSAADSDAVTQPQQQLLEAIQLRSDRQVVRLVADEVSLHALALRIEAISGIDVVIAPDLSQTVVNVRVASPNWEAALQQLFSGYSTVAGWDQQGRVRSFYVLASTARDSSLEAATSEPTPTTTLPAPIPPAIAGLGTQSTSAAQTVPDYALHTEEAAILELMSVPEGNGSTALELLPYPQHRPEIRELLQRMRTVGKPMETTITERHLATATSEQARTPAQTPQAGSGRNNPVTVGNSRDFLAR